MSIKLCLSLKKKKTFINPIVTAAVKIKQKIKGSNRKAIAFFDTVVHEVYLQCAHFKLANLKYVFVQHYYLIAYTLRRMQTLS